MYCMSTVLGLQLNSGGDYCSYDLENKTRKSSIVNAQSVGDIIKN